MPTYLLRAPATPESIAELREQIAEVAARAGLSDLWAVKLCLSEALTNVIVHAYAGEAGRDVDIATATPADGTLRLMVSDRGCGFQPRSDRPGLGVGLPIIAKLATKVDIHSGHDGGTVLYMEFSEREMRSREALPV